MRISFHDVGEMSEKEEMTKVINIGTIEATAVEYKLSLEQERPKSWLKTVSAFANTSGGHIYFGVTNDTHDPVGLDNAQICVSKIAELISGRITPLPRYQITEIPSNTKNKSCIDLAVDNGPNYPYYYAHEKTKEAYVRHGDRSEIAKDYELNNLVLKGQHRTYDSLPGDYKLSDVSFTLLAATFKHEVGDALELPRDLISMGLVDVDNTVSNAGLLLCDQGLIPQSRVFCTRWKGVNKGSVEGDALDDKEYKGESLISLLDDAEAFIRNNSKNPWSINGMRRVEKSDYPFKAVREALVNAMMHRDYQIIGAEVHVDIYDNRLEITSPGGMLNGKRIQDLDLRQVPSMRRNEIIADFFGRLHYMDRRGSGIGRILDAYAGHSVAPQFLSDTSFFKVILPNRRMEEQIQLPVEEGDFQSSNSSLGNRNDDIESSQDWELAYFRDAVMSQFKNDFREKRFNQIIELFDRYRYEYHFNRRIVAGDFGIVENTASITINKCIKLGIMERVKQDEYRFARKQNNR